MEKIRKLSFPSKSRKEWEEKVEQSLKGKTVGSLQSSTYENIILKPLYSRQDEHLIPDYPGGADYRRGAYPLGYLSNEWKVAQRISFETAEELTEKLMSAVEKGQTALSFEVANFKKNESLAHLLSDLSHKLPFSINTKGYQDEFLTKLSEISGESLTGYIANDPISLFVEEGAISNDFLQSWKKEIVKADEKYPNLRTVLIDTTPYHNGGANAVQELGIAIAEGVYYLQQLLENGMETAFSKMIFQFAIGSNFFMEIAKLRAARILWNKVAEVYGFESGTEMQIAVETSAFTKAVHDPHVNILRSGNEAFAAVIGGVQYLHVEPFDAVTGSNSFSERVARNIQLILKEEAHLKTVIDPAGGSWYIENLTTQIAEKAWEFFQQIEAKGGILEAITSNWLQQEVAAVYEKRTTDSHTRKQSIVGTNVYAKLDEIVPVPKKPMKSKALFEKQITIQAISKRRLADPFEELRSRAKQLEEKLRMKPAVGMIGLGDLKLFKARLDFMKGFLAAGGIHTSESEPIFTVEEASRFVSEQPVNHFCFCGTNELYEEVGHEILTALKTEFPEKTFFLAGFPEEQTQWLEQGIKKFIHIKSNCYETLTEILSEMEGHVNEA